MSSGPYVPGPGTQFHGGDDTVRNVHVYARASLPPLSSYEFVRGASTDVSVVIRVYGWNGVLVGAYTGVIGSSVQTFAQLCSVASVPSTWAFAEIDAQSTTASATTFYMESGSVSANSRQFDAPANTAAKAVYTIGRFPVS